MGAAIAVPAIISALTATGAMVSSNQATQHAKGAAQAAADQQRNSAGDLQKQIATQPQQVQPDNFLAMKSKALQSLRLGIASTMTGAAGNTQSLMSGGLKGKLGS